MRALISFVVAAVTVVLQLTVVDRIAFPGGAGPDLVLLVVAALALAGGPMAGVLTGFWAGLALDVAPPGSHFIGQNALVFCLVGYACGLLADASGDAETEHTALFEILVTAAGAVCGEALAALLGVMLSDPRVTWPAIRHVLPAAMAYNVLLCPFVLYAAAAALRLAGVPAEGRPAGWSASQVRAPLPAANQGAIRQLAGGSGPRLRLSERDRGPGPRGPGTARREPQLKLGLPRQRTAAASVAPSGLTAHPAKVRFGGRSRAGVLGGSLIGGAGSAGAAFRGSGLGGPRFGRSTMGRSLLGGSVFGRSSASLGASSALGRPSRSGRPAAFGRAGVFGRPAPLGRSSPLRHRGNAFAGAGGLAGLTPRFPRDRSLARLTGVLRRSAGPKSPGRGWLRGASARGTSLGGRPLRRGPSLGRGAFGRRRLGGMSRGWGSQATPRLTPRTRLRMPRPKPKRSRRTGGYR